MHEFEHRESSEIDYSNPFRVRVIVDHRSKDEFGPSGDLSGQDGTCLGLFDTESLEPDLENGNPLIMTDVDEMIWGIQSTWIPLNDETAKMSLHDLRQRAETYYQALKASLGEFDINPN